MGQGSAGQGKEGQGRAGQGRAVAHRKQSYAWHPLTVAGEMYTQGEALAEEAGANKRSDPLRLAYSSEGISKNYTGLQDYRTTGHTPAAQPAA